MQNLITTRALSTFAVALALFAHPACAEEGQKVPIHAVSVVPVEVPLKDANGATRFVLSVRSREEGQDADVRLLDANGNIMAMLDAQQQQQQLPDLEPVISSEVKTDASSPKDIKFLQQQIDTLRVRLNDAITRLNALSK